MDIPRESAARKRRIRRILYSIAAVVAIVLTSVGVSHLKPAAPSVDRATIWPDTVKRGPMLIEVRGLGTLVPEEVLWIPAVTDGRVERRFVLPGTPVKADTVLLTLSNPEQQQGALDAEWQLKAAEAQYDSLKAQLDSQLLDQRSTAATVQSDYRQAKIQADTDAELARLGLGSTLTLNLDKTKAEALATRNEIEQNRVVVTSKSAAAQLSAQKARVEQLRALCNLKKGQLESLRVRAGADGVLQDLPVEEGQKVAAGTILAKVVQPTRLKAQLQIAETQAKDIQSGQVASIDTHNGVIPGHVMRIDPAAVNGTVTVDVKLEGELPKGARPALSVDGTIEIERLDDVVYVSRPAFGQPNSTVSLFKTIGGGKEAVRVQVQMGRSSVNTIEIKGGLKVGDEVILSDMSRWDGFDRIRLE